MNGPKYLKIINTADEKNRGNYCFHQQSMVCRNKILEVDSALTDTCQRVQISVYAFSPIHLTHYIKHYTEPRGQTTCSI